MKLILEDFKVLMIPIKKLTAAAKGLIRRNVKMQNHHNVALEIIIYTVWSYSVEVPHSEGQSSPWRIVCFSLSVSVAGDVQVHSILDILLGLNNAVQYNRSSFTFFLFINYQ